MKPLRTFLSVVAALLIAASLPAATAAHTSRMQAIRQLPIAVQAERSAQLEKAVARTGALGTYWDQAADQIVVVTPASGTSSFRVADVDSLGLDVRVVTRDIEPADIDAIQNQLRDRKWDASARGTSFLSFFDAKKGRVVIASDVAPARFQYFSDRFPGKVEYVQAQLDLEQSRKTDGPPHWGGAELDRGVNIPRCTSGFAVRRGSAAMMLTAQHCYLRFEGVIGGSPNSWPWGSVQYVGVATDTELIGGNTYQGYIYVGTLTGTGKAVTGASDPVSWHTYCVSGMMTAEGCGHTYNGVTGWQCLKDGHCYTGFAMFAGGKQTIEGDSGAPWYFYDPNGKVYVAGIHTGRLTIGGVDYMLATPWSRIVSDLGVSIITG